MAAGLGFKTFNTGDVLSSSDTNGYLMQGTWVFADAAARSAAVTSPQEGNMSYLKDTNSTEYYSGSAWVAVGAAGGGMTLLQTLALTGSSVTSSTISGSYTNLYVLIKNYYSDNGSAISMRLNGDTGSNYFHYYIRNDNGSVSGAVPTTGSDIGLSGASGTTSTYKELGYAEFTIPRYSATENKAIFFNTYFGGAYKYFAIRYALWDNTAAITSLTIKCDGGNFSGGNAYIYGVK